MGEMTNEDLRETAAREQLQRTIDLLCDDAARVELWACALNGFAQAVPAYPDPFAKAPVKEAAENES
jgi:hypothetical protein